MKIPKDYDCVNREAPAYSAGTNPFDNPQIEPRVIKATPGEKATNVTAAESSVKPQPFSKKGSGYTK